MKQLDLFEEALHEKIRRIEKNISHLHRRMRAMENDLIVTKMSLEFIRPAKKKNLTKIEQLSMFEGVV